MDHSERLAILGGGNLGCALARGWVRHGGLDPATITVTRRQFEKLSDLADAGFVTTESNRDALASAKILVIAVQPQQLDGLLDDVRDVIDAGRHMVVSVVSGMTIAALRDSLGRDVPIVRAMPNTAVGIGEAMTCLAAEDDADPTLTEAAALFGRLGQTLLIRETMMTPATALCACGVAFFLRCVRAASQGGIEIGFHPEEALLLAAQTAKGAAALLLNDDGGHPEREIDRVTTPRGCTIAGLNEMEHRGLSSALIRGIVISADRAGDLGDE